jgi:hypothetical protein
MEVQKVEQEDVPNQEEQQLVFPKIIAPRVLLEILVYGTFEEGTDAKDSDAYKKAIELQDQIDRLRGKDKFRVRILWKTLEGEMTPEKEIEMQEWLIENSSCKYYLFAASFWGIEAFYIKDRLKMIQKFEKELAIFKESKIELKRK